jgi:hypothetical protein
MDGKPTLTQYAMRNEAEVDKVARGSALLPQAAKTVLKEQAALIRMMAAAIDTLKLEKKA